jgi:uncharacterized protein
MFLPVSIWLTLYISYDVNLPVQLAGSDRNIEARYFFCYNKKMKKNFVVLFNYGGGMRGLVPAHLMARIEEATGFKMADMVDVFAGPSTGSILNAALTIPHPDFPERPKYKARHLVRFYEREGIKIFPQDRFRAFRGLIHDFNNRTMKLNQLNWLFRHGHYDSKNLAHALRMLFGKHKIEQAISGLVIPVYNIDGDQIEVVEEFNETGDDPVRTKNNFYETGGHALWIKHMDTGHGFKPDMDISLVDAVLASCAAPTFFPCHHFPVRYAKQKKTVYYSGIDGSIFDNPCISYHGAIRNHIPPDSNVIMIVLGTGYTNRSFTRHEWNRMGALGVVDPVNDLPLINIFFHASETALMDSFAESMGDNLYVFNKSLFPTNQKEDYPSPQIDDASPENVERLKRFADLIYEENQVRFDSLCELLVQNKKDRDSQEKKKKGFLSGILGMD